MRRGPAMFFGAIVAFGLGPAVWVGGTFATAEADAVPGESARPVPSVSVSTVYVAVEPSVAPEVLEIADPWVPPSATPSASPSATPSITPSARTSPRITPGPPKTSPPVTPPVTSGPPVEQTTTPSTPATPSAPSEDDVEAEA
ncbi:hypothetical protein J2S43_000200 [Catenuloplanes nepalensis]|uniref:Uncharacterized protein n=1 Tax=Catenuloplanes nepalensis TaxID=587533 RepID=A0ABT9MK78_9ACTN|nr:hypothetical protein [Catenuloplanes nepalensis]MDP9791688.1 hypothetical protein [Catenuloplanes nepalensis]